MVGVDTTWGTVLKGNSGGGKVENPALMLCTVVESLRFQKMFSSQPFPAPPQVTWSPPQIFDWSKAGRRGHCEGDGRRLCFTRVWVEAVSPCYPKELLVFLTLSILLWAPSGGLRKKRKCCISRHIVSCWASSHSACDSLFTLHCFFEAVTSILCQRWSLCGSHLSLWTFIVLRVCFPLFCGLWLTRKYNVNH